MLDVAEDTLLHPAPNTEEYLLSNLSAALMDIKDTRAIPTLERLLSSSNSRTRLGVIIALRQMHSSEGIVSLVAALEDIDRDVRYEAVMGLAELTGQNSWRPAISVFQDDEQRYLDHWKAWAQNR
jgi:HEAT repeat protein